MTEVERLRMLLEPIRDAQLVGKTWKEVEQALVMEPTEPVEFETWAATMYSCWLYANLADAALNGTPVFEPVAEVIRKSGHELPA